MSSTQSWLARGSENLSGVLPWCSDIMAASGEGSWIVDTDGPRVTVEGELEAGGRVTATCRGLFVAVEPGHPAYHRW